MTRTFRTILVLLLPLLTLAGCDDAGEATLAYENGPACEDFSLAWEDEGQRSRAAFTALWQLEEPCCGPYLHFGERAPDGLPAYRVAFDRGAQEILDLRSRVLQTHPARCVRFSHDLHLEETFTNCHDPATLEGADGPCHLSKMPGLWGSVDGEAVAGGCIDRDAMEARGAWSARLQWSGSAGGISPRIYPYALNKAERCGGGVPGVRRAGRSVLPTGRWVTLTQEICLNEPGRANGSQALWIDGVLREVSEAVEWRADADVRVSGIWLNFYTGGRLDKPQNRSPRDQSLWMRNFRLETCGADAPSSKARRSHGPS